MKKNERNIKKKLTQEEQERKKRHQELKKKFIALGAKDVTRENIGKSTIIFPGEKKRK